MVVYQPRKQMKNLQSTVQPEILVGIKFGGMVVYLCNCQIKIRQYFILYILIHMPIPYLTTKFKSANVHVFFATVIWGPTANM